MVFDLDGTLLDSDAALTAPFLELGIRAEDVAFGALLEEECARLGLAVGEYLARYDVTSAQPFPGVAELVVGLDRWAVCSNKVGESGRAELARLGWAPALALFAEDFGGRPEGLGPVLAALSVPPGTSSSWATPPTIAAAPRRRAAPSRWRGGTRGRARPPVTPCSPVPPTCWPCSGNS